MHRGVLCSIDRPPVLGETQGGVSGAGGGGALGGKDFSVGATVDTSVAIGGVEDLLEFVRSSVLAGPRPSSFAFHERSLRSVLLRFIHRVSKCWRYTAMLIVLLLFLFLLKFLLCCCCCFLH